MSRLIIFNDFLSGSKDKGHILDSLHYISEREGVEKNHLQEVQRKIPLNPATAAKSITSKQKELIDDIITNYPDLKDDLPYEEFKKNINMYSASRFIAESLQQLEELSYSNEIYMQYISTRPGVDKNNNQHGLFDVTGEADIESIHKELLEKDGNVWRSIISLRRNDAEELDFENQSSWKGMIIKHIPLLAKEMNIPFENFRWCAAFHNESYHPHIHMMYWSKKENEGFCSKETIRNFKSALTNDIFSNEIWLHKEFKTEKRNEFEKIFKEKLASQFNDLFDKSMKTAMNSLPTLIYKNLIDLSTLVNDHGSHYYQYQSKEAKELTDLICSKILTSPDLKPIMDEYLKAQVDLSSFYMKNDSDSMKKYMNNFCEKLIHPGKSDRKVIHNEIIKAAYEIKKDTFLKELSLNPAITDIKNLLDNGIYPQYVKPENTDKLAKSICRFSMYLDHDPKKAIERITPLIPSKEKRLELLLNLRSSKEDILENSNIRESDWKAIQKAYFGYQSTQDYIQPDNTMHHCAKLLHSVLNWLTTNTNESLREAHRLYSAMREDEFMLKKMHFMEKNKK